MEEMMKSKKGVPVWAQLLFLIIWIGGVASLSSLGGGNDAESASIDAIMTPGLIRVLIVFQAVLVFFLPIVFFIFLLRQSGISFLTLGVRPRIVWVLLGVGAIFCSLPFVSWLGEVNSAIKLPESFSGMERWMKSMETQSSKTSEILLNDKSFSGLIFNLLTIAFTAAFSEELFFRAVLQRTITETKINFHFGVWFAAVVFSAIHMQFYGFFPRLILGAILGYLFYFTGSIWISIIAHFINNAFVVVLGFLSDTGVNLNPLEKVKDEPDFIMSWPLVTLSFISVIGIIFYLQKITKQKSVSVTLID